jgi:hypothetical protein
MMWTELKIQIACVFVFLESGLISPSPKAPELSSALYKSPDGSLAWHGVEPDVSF